MTTAICYLKTPKILQVYCRMYESESESTRGVHKVRSLTQMDTRKLNDIMSQVTNNHRYLLAQVIIGVTYLW